MISTSILLYLAKVALAQLVFYSLYILLFRKLKFFQGNRFYLLYTALLSFAIPLIPYQASLTQSVADLPVLEAPITNMRSEIAQLENTIMPPPESHDAIDEEAVFGDQLVAGSPYPDSNSSSDTNWNLMRGLGLIYISGVIVALLFFLGRLRSIWKMYSDSSIAEVGGRKVYINTDVPTSSFFRLIFWNPTESDESTQASILAHELVHCRQWHSLDNIILQINTIVLWFSPVSYWLAKQMHLQHEFIADYFAAKNDDSHTYRDILIEHLQQFGRVKSTAPAVPFASMLHSRIDKLEQPNQRRAHAFKFLFLIPVLLGVVLVLSQSDVGGLVTPHITKKATLLTQPILELGDISFQFDLLNIQGKNRFVCNAYLDYSSMTQNWYHPWKVSSEQIHEIEVHRLSMAVKEMEGQSMIKEITSVESLGLDTELISVVPQLHELTRDNYIVVDGYFNEVPFRLNIWPNHQIDRSSMTLRFQDRAFQMLTEGHLMTYTISPVELKQLLSGVRDVKEDGAVRWEHTTWINNGQEEKGISIRKKGMISILKNGLQTISYEKTRRILSSSDYIENPIIVTLAGVDGLLYQVAFANQKSANLVFEDLVGFGESQLRLRNATVSYEHQPIAIEWGPITILPGKERSVMHNRLLVDDVMTVGYSRIGISKIMEVLREIPKNAISGKEIELQILVHDGANLISECTTTAQGEIPSCLAAFLEEVRVGNTIDIRQIHNKEEQLLFHGISMPIVADDYDPNKIIW